MFRSISDDLAESKVIELSCIAAAHDVSDVAAKVIKDPRFKCWSGSSKPDTHHYGKGGLITHTLEVVKLCSMASGTILPRVQDFEDFSRRLFLAALFHDWGKTLDYINVDPEMNEWTITPHKKRINHIAASYSHWLSVSAELKVPTADQDEIAHAILAHHGQKEWGSPVTPKTRLAWTLHICDHMSARYDDCEKHADEEVVRSLEALAYAK